MSALVLYGPTERSSLPRWSAAAIIVVLLHAALISAGALWYVQNQTAGTPLPPILVDLVPVSASPETQPLDLAPGPAMQEAPEPQAQPIPEPELKEELIPPTPLQEKPVVVAPPEQKEERKVKTEQQPRSEPKPIKQAKKQSEKPPAPTTAASPKAEQRAPPASSAVGAASSAAAAASYRQLISAHIQRFKQFPPSSRAAGEQGVPRVSFTIDRSGRLLSVSLIGRSGFAALDADATATIRRAQPMPPFPAEMKQGRETFNVGLNYTLR